MKLKPGITCKIKSILLVLVLIVFTSTQVSSNQNAALNKLGSKVEKVIINQILAELKKTDYDSYRVLLALWQGIKTQSGTAIERNLRQLLIEKGFVYTIHTRGFRWAEAGLTSTIFANELFAGIQKTDSEYLRMLCDRYDYVLQAHQLGTRYFLETDFIHIRRILNRYKHASPHYKPDFNLPKTASYIAVKLLFNQDLEFKDRAYLRTGKGRQEFEKDITRYLEVNLAQRKKYKKLMNVHRKVSRYADDIKRQYRFREWSDRFGGSEQVRKVYFEMVSYMSRTIIAGSDSGALGQTRASFRNTAMLLKKVDPGIRFKGNSLKNVMQGLWQRYQEISKEKEPLAYAATAARYTFFENLLKNTRAATQTYQSTNSFYNAFYSSDFIEDYFIDPWFRNLRKSGWLGHVFKPNNNKPYKEFTTYMYLVAIMTDHFLNRNEDRLVINFQRFAYRVQENLDNFTLNKLSDASISSEKYGLKDTTKRLIENALAYALHAKSFSRMVTYLKYTMHYSLKFSEKTGKGLITRASVKKLQQYFDKSGTMFWSPVIQSLYLNIATALANKSSMVELETETAKLRPLLVAEVLGYPQHTKGQFAYFTQWLKIQIPVLNISMRSVLEYIALKDEQSFRRLLAANYQKSMDASLKQLGSDVKSISEPFIRTAMRSAVLNEKVTVKEYTAVAIDTIKGIERSTGWLHLSIGFSVGHFSNTGFSDNSTKLYISDKVGIDFIGLGYGLADSTSTPSFGLGIFAGGFFDYLLSEVAKLETRNLTGGDNYLKTGLFLSFRHPSSEILHFSIEAGAAFSFQGDPVFYAATSWNVFDLTDIL